MTPMLDDFLLDGTGSFHVARVSGISAGLVGFIIIICCGLCYKFKGYRSCMKGFFMRLIPNFISEQYNKCIFYKETKKFKKDLTVDLASKVEESERKRIRMMGEVKPKTHLVKHLKK